MRDSRREILKQLIILLEPIGLPVYSVVPDNVPHPFIYIGSIQTQQTLNKQNFEILGTVEVELFTGTNEWSGSLDVPLGYLESIKMILQPSVNFVLPLGSSLWMVWWTLFNDTGLFTISSTEKIYSAVLQYEFEISDNTKFVIHNGIQGTHDNKNVIH